MKTFWQFAYERQRIWHARQVLGLRAPWTDDPILRDFWFVNVHRELDIGTIVLRQSLELAHQDETRAVFTAMLYRVFNNYRAWQHVEGGATHIAQVPEMITALREYHHEGNAVFTAAWTISPLPYAGIDRLAKVQTAITELWPHHLNNVLWAARNARSLQEVHRALSKVPLMGQFTAFQVALDFTYIFPHLSDNEWVLTYSSANKKAKAEYADAGSGATLKALGGSLKELRDSCDTALALDGLTWDTVALAAKPRPTLADVEHTLCEYNKYLRFHIKPLGRRYLA